ncbi:MULTISPECIES: hypothetical protein [Streptomyces]|uniref:Uncharacterized protein n=2 Tax=Streptomyces TaxID=1883 RepID=A0ABV9IQ00_9ACTN
MTASGFPWHPLRGQDRVRRAQAEGWLLAAAHFDRKRAPEAERAAIHDWERGTVALLTAGVTWDVVRVPYNALSPGFSRDTNPDELRQRLADLKVHGAAFCDPYRPYLYVMVPAGTDREWPARQLADVECMGSSKAYIHHVGVPRVDRIAPPGLYWLTSPDAEGPHYADWQHLFAVLRDLQDQAEARAASGAP